MMQDPYRLLGLNRDATSEQIKRAFRQHSLRWHPDTNPNPAAAERFAAIAGAYACLTDPHARRRYDANHPQRGADRRLTLDIEIWEKYAGASRIIPLAIFDRCSSCSGVGRVGRTCPCPSCAAGTLMYWPQERPRDGACEVCEGFGILGRICQDCQGSGRRLVQQRLQITLTRNVQDGALIRLKGAGDAGILAGPRGDVLITLRVLPIPNRFRTAPPQVGRLAGSREFSRRYLGFDWCCAVDFVDGFDKGALSRIIT